MNILDKMQFQDAAYRRNAERVNRALQHPGTTMDEVRRAAAELGYYPEPDGSVRIGKMRIEDAYGFPRLRR